MKLTSDHRDKLLDILRWRRDVRQFRRDVVAPELLAMLEAAIDHAPSVGNSRPWRIVRVKEKASRAAIIAAFEKANSAASEIYKGKTRRDYLALKLAGLREAPVHWAFFTEPDPCEGRGLGRQTMPETLAYSTVMAIHTVWLAARALNLGVGWVSILDPADVSAALRVPEQWQFTAYLCIGYPAELSDRPELERRGWQADRPSVWLDR